MNLWQQFW